MTGNNGYYDDDLILYKVSGEVKDTAEVFLTEEQAEKLMESGLDVVCVDLFDLTDLDAFDDDDDEWEWDDDDED